MKRLSKLLLTLFAAGMLITFLAVLSGCANSQPVVIRGSSQVLILHDGDVVKVPEWFAPRELVCLSPEAAEDLFRAADRKEKK